MTGKNTSGETTYVLSIAARIDATRLAGIPSRSQPEAGVQDDGNRERGERAGPHRVECSTGPCLSLLRPDSSYPRAGNACPPCRPR